MNVTKENINKIKETIKLIQQFMNLPDMIKLKKDNNEEYIKKMTEIFPVFAENYNSLFNLVISENDLHALDFMFETMINISNGTLEKDKAEMAFGDYLATKYVKPKIDPKKLKRM